MENYPSNSYKHKAEQREKQPQKREKLVSNAVTVRKKNEVKRFADAFIADDVTNLKDYVIRDVIIPGAKDAISDIARSLGDLISGSVDRAMYGENGRNQGRGAGHKASYTKYYDDKNRRRDYTAAHVRTAGYKYDDIIFNNRGEAEMVLRQLRDDIARYGLVSVAALYEYAGVTGNYTNNNFGWTDLSVAEVTRIRAGYVIKLPTALELD